MFGIFTMLSGQGTGHQHSLSAPETIGGKQLKLSKRLILNYNLLPTAHGLSLRLRTPPKKPLQTDNLQKDFTKTYSNVLLSEKWYQHRPQTVQVNQLNQIALSTTLFLGFFSTVYFCTSRVNFCSLKVYLCNLKVYLYFESILLYLESIPLYFESIPLYFESILLHFESTFVYFESILLYFQSILLYFESIL